MLTPFEMFMQYQLALCDGWLRMMRESMDIYQHFLKEQTKMLNHPEYLRAKDLIPCGADWLDHYGKRCHDVDVERV